MTVGMNNSIGTISGRLPCHLTIQVHPDDEVRR
jgi:hypothetical protein